MNPALRLRSLLKYVLHHPDLLLGLELAGHAKAVFSRGAADALCHVFPLLSGGPAVILYQRRARHKAGPPPGRNFFKKGLDGECPDP